MLTFMVDFKSLVLIVIGVRVKTVQRILTCPRHSQLILLRLHTRITLHAQTAAQQQSNGIFLSQDVREMWRVERLVYHDFIPNPLGPSAR